MKRKIKERIGIMRQKSFGVYGNLTAFENVVGALDGSDVEKEVTYDRVAEILQSVELMHRSSHLANDLSGGEKQRLVLARQLARNPIALLADDPTGTLDPVNAKMVSETLSSLPYPTVLIVTSHIPALIDIVCSRVVLMEHGKVLGTGLPREMIKRMHKEIESKRGTTLLEKKEASPSAQPIVRLSGVHKIYHKITSGIVKAVDGVDLTIDEGIIIGIVGKSGAGKTTLSKIIGGVTSPTRGSVSVRVGDDWVDLNQPGPAGKGRATRYVSILYQEYSLYSHLTVLENLANSKDLNIPDQFAKMKAIYTLKRLGFSQENIHEILTRYPDSLSEGERHRVALARALMRDPTILILDEPSGTMDRETKREVSVALKSLRDEFGMTVIMVSHDVEFSLQTCDMLALMENGKITIIGPPTRVIRALEGGNSTVPSISMFALGESISDNGISEREII